jgi:phosphosulfolactate synthase
MTHPLLDLPRRPDKPRDVGVTMVIDGGLATQHFEDVMSSHGQFVDFVKFGWGTSLVTRDLSEKIAVLNNLGIRFYFGGSFFEKALVQGRFDRFRAFCHEMGGGYVEVSNGTIELTEADKATYVKELCQDFRVISEVGLKDQTRSDLMSPRAWVGAIDADLDAGAYLVTLETRESGTGGLCRSNGELRYGLLEEILESGVDVDRLLFEAPTSTLQGYFVRRIGTDVNVGNVAPNDIVGLETLRLGLRSETLLLFEDGDGSERLGPA